MGPPKEGKLFWDRWLQEYYQDRVPVAVDVERVTVWSALDCSGTSELHGAAAAGDPPPQAEPKNGSGPARGRCARRAAPSQPRPRAAGLRRGRRLPGGGPGRGRATPALTASGSRRRSACRREGAGPESGPFIPREADRPRGPPAHRLADRRRRGSALRPSHRERLQGASEQDPAAVRQRPARKAGPAPGAQAGCPHRCRAIMPPDMPEPPAPTGRSSPAPASTRAINAVYALRATPR